MEAEERPDKLDAIFTNYRKKPQFTCNAVEGFVINHEHTTIPGPSETVSFDTQIVFPVCGEPPPGPARYILLRVWGNSTRSRISSYELNVSCKLAEGKQFMLLTIPSGDTTVYQPDLQTIAEYAKEKLGYPEVDADTVVTWLEKVIGEFAETS
eukprot:TRINITY_DN50506_c0_g1_i2.p1 TRINITY_DN50506_c0_g1~~TRINITY_DN50506_c0_g1_i2.p1  ORF type:complete len:153 (-),score=23.76 TRINITY_DN50506_c0_g1_i2:365-823(-)